MRRITGWFMATGAAFLLLFQLLVFLREHLYLMDIMDRLWAFLIGPPLIVSLKFQTFHPIDLLWLPWSAAILALILAKSIRIIRHDISTSFPFTISFVGLLMLVAVVIEKTPWLLHEMRLGSLTPYYNIYAFWENAIFPIPIIRDLGNFLTIIGIGLFALMTRKRVSHQIPTQSSGLKTRNVILTVFGGYALVSSLILFVMRDYLELNKLDTPEKQKFVSEKISTPGTSSSIFFVNTDTVYHYNYTRGRFETLFGGKYEVHFEPNRWKTFKRQIYSDKGIQPEDNVDFSAHLSLYKGVTSMNFNELI